MQNDSFEKRTAITLRRFGKIGFVVDAENNTAIFYPTSFVNPSDFDNIAQGDMIRCEFIESKGKENRLKVVNAIKIAEVQECKK